MRIFLKHTIQFFIILYGAAIALLLLSNYLINSKANFKLKPNTNKVVIGNSHPAGTFNDSLISNIKNLADPGDSYFYGYQKLKEIIKQNPQVDTVYIEFNPKTILLWEDSKIWKKHQIPNYLSFFEIQDHYLLATNNGLAYQQEVFKGIMKNLKRITLNQYHIIDSLGGFRYVKSTRLQAILDTVSYNPQKQFKIDQISLSKYDITYLKRIVTLCNTQNIQVIFVRSPYHNMFDGRQYETIFQNYRMEHFSSIAFLDFQDFPTEDSEFKDLEHLNDKGSRKFSLWFEQQNY